MKYVVGDVRDVLKNHDYGHFVHGVNCQGKFASGIAAIVRELVPSAAEAYEYVTSLRRSAGDPPSVHLGTIHRVPNNEGGYVWNMFTQERYGYDDKRYVSYDAIDACFLALAEVAPASAPIVFPMVGAGLGGGRWPVIVEIIDHRLRSFDYHCVVRAEDVFAHNLQNMMP